MSSAVIFRTLTPGPRRHGGELTTLRRTIEVRLWSMALLGLGLGASLGLMACGAEETSALSDASAVVTDAPATVDASSGRSDGALDLDASPDARASDDAALDAGQAADTGIPTSCDGPRGSHHDLALRVDGEARAYFLYVPEAYTCDRSWPVLVDFHGTATGPRPEEAYGQEALLATADAEGFIVVRPRSRSSLEGGQQIYRWDQNPGDLARNVRFTRALVAELAAHYRVGTLYTSGFSSGSNMIVQLSADVASSFAGYGYVAGGTWSPAGPLTASARAARHYFATGHRDYLHDAARARRVELAEANVPEAQVFVRETDGGHELYDWHFPELWAWLTRGERPAQGTLAAGWTPSGPLPEPRTVLALARTATGTILASGADGHAWTRDRAGVWRRTGLDARGASLVALAVLPGGRALAAGEGVVLDSDDAGHTWRTAPAIPELPAPVFGAARVNGLAAGGVRRFIAGAAFTAALSDDGGRRWVASRMTYDGLDVVAQINAVAIGTSSVTVAAGYYYLGSSRDGLSFTQRLPPREAGWLNDVVYLGGSRWCVVGDRGAVFVSDDDGETWVDRSPGTALNLYAVDFWEHDRGLAVGQSGAAWRTLDGGATWQDVSTGLDVMLGDVVLTGRWSALVGGEGGLLLEHSLPL